MVIQIKASTVIEILYPVDKAPAWISDQQQGAHFMNDLIRNC